MSRAVRILTFALAMPACGGSSGDSAGPPSGDSGTLDTAVEATVDAHADAGPDAVVTVDAGDAAVDAPPTPACVMRASQLQSALDQAKGQSPGAVLAVLTPDCGKWVGATGTSTPATALDPGDVLRIGSITKTFVATAVLQLVTAGTVSLADPLEKWVPGFPNGTAITVRHVLNHTSGIFNYTDDTTFQQTEGTTPSTVWTPAQLVAIAASHAPYFAPGMGWTYSNTDYILAGMLLEKATGKKAGSVIHSLAIDKAGLKLTTLDGYEAIKGTLAHGFAMSGADVTSIYDPSYAWTAGAMVSSGGDLVDWAAALYGGNVLDAAALAMMGTTVDTGTAGEHYGLGLFVLDPSLTGGTTAWGHPGDINGYHSQLFYFPAKKIAVAAIVNGDSGDPNAVTVAALGVLGYP